ncbi:MAG TPA: efflux RND transporter periplasmic adaptor subunit [Kamptonema sp.]|nr:efflux RND transporter periplasmic adaptor subunit [Kamptonema sp.]
MGKQLTPKDKSFAKPTGKGTILLASAASAAIALVGFWQVSQLGKSHNSESTAAPASAPTPKAKAVTALGRLSPKGEVIKVAAPSLSEGSKIEQLRVEEGDRVREGQVIAILDSRDRLRAALEQAEKEVKVQLAELAKIKAGAKTGEISAQQAEITRLEAQSQREAEAQKAKVARLEAQLQRQTEIAEANLARLQAQLERQTQGEQAKLGNLQAQLRGEIATQNATVDRLQAELRNARSEDKRNQELYQTGAISASAYDTKRLTLETSVEKLKEAKANLNRTIQTLQQQINEAKANLTQTIETGQEQINQAKAELNQTLETVAQEVNQAKAELNQILETGPAQINQAKATLDKIAEVRPEDVQAASAAVERAIAAKEKAQAEFDLTSVKAPADGQILKINTRQGERISFDNGIVDLGRTNQMYVIAEVYETDISQLRRGQRASITSTAFTGTLEGTVDLIGKQIGKKDVLNTDPAADTDARVIEVKIRLDPEASKKVADLTNLQVDVKISL